MIFGTNKLHTYKWYAANFMLMNG